MSGKSSKTIKDDKKVQSTKSSNRRSKPNHTKASKETKVTESKQSSDFVCSKGEPTNDPRWYLNNPNLSRDAASIWFSKPVGSRLPHSAIITGGQIPTSTRDTLEPGILAIPTVVNVEVAI